MALSISHMSNLYCCVWRPKSHCSVNTCAHNIMWISYERFEYVRLISRLFCLRFKKYVCMVIFQNTFLINLSLYIYRWNAWPTRFGFYRTPCITSKISISYFHIMRLLYAPRRIHIICGAYQFVSGCIVVWHFRTHCTIVCTFIILFTASDMFLQKCATCIYGCNSVYLGSHYAQNDMIFYKTTFVIHKLQIVMQSYASSFYIALLASYLIVI